MKNFLTAFLILPITLFCQIESLSSFLNTCPMDDPVTPQILQDFKITLGKEDIQVPSCNNSYLNEKHDVVLATLQMLRFVYYFPQPEWTDKSLYDWAKDEIQGVDLNPNSLSGICCLNLNDERQVVISGLPYESEFEDFFSEKRFLFTYIDILQRTSLFLHEVRHAEKGMQHISGCCEFSDSCDDEFNEELLKPYALSVHLYNKILDGTYLIGFWNSEHDAEIHEFANTHVNAVNNNLRRICNNTPEPLEGVITGDEFWGGKSQTTSTKEINTDFVIYPNPIREGQHLNISDYKIFDLSGNELDELKRGVNVVVTKNGSRKVVVE